MIYKLFFYVKIAQKNLLIHKGRMILAILGILFAVMSLFSFGNISEGMKKKIDKEIGRFGKNLIILRAGFVHPTPRGMRVFQESKTLKLSTIVKMKENLREISMIVPFFDSPFPARFRQNKVQALVVGTTSNFFLIKDIRPYTGRLFDEEDGREKRRVAVIGYKVYKNLFSDDPCGKYILIHRVPVEVIGVLEEKGVDYTGQDQDLQILVPLETFMKRFVNEDFVKGAYIQVEEGVKLEEMKEKLRRFLRQLRGLKEEEKDDFTIFTMEDIIRIRQEGIRLVSILTVISSVICFIIGGLGIFAIMLLSVSERKIEIGIRRATGSTKRNIFIQFLIESGIIAGIGGVIGLFFGFMITLIVDYIGDFPFSVKLFYLFISLFITALTGILSGIYPALQGRKYEPVQVLYQ